MPLRPTSAVSIYPMQRFNLAQERMLRTLELVSAGTLSDT
jgi:hypothetical protein